ncbi:hypothetical protein R3P38DRAFT_3242136 [Favolaschia claudopus]|uniref:Uncharacterized protein n=1 Tax=Favolaschia claudopus TaxID=2862362 RepID=A0AAV9Z589_9AGAR
MSTSSLPPGDAEFNPPTKASFNFQCASESPSPLNIIPDQELTSKEKNELKKYIDTLIAHLQQYEEDEDLKAQAIRQFNRAWDNIKNYSAPKERSMRNLLRTISGKARGPVKAELDAMWQKYEDQSRERKEQEHFNNHAASPFDSVPEYVWGINRPSTDFGGVLTTSSGIVAARVVITQAIQVRRAMLVINHPPILDRAETQAPPDEAEGASQSGALGTGNFWSYPERFGNTFLRTTN